MFFLDGFKVSKKALVKFKKNSSIHFHHVGEMIIDLVGRESGKEK